MTRAVSLIAFLLASLPAVAAVDDLPRLQLRPSLLLLASSEDKGAEEKAPDKTEGGDVVDESSSTLPDKEVKAAGTVLSESVGGATGFVFKQGFYTQSDLGGYFVLGAAAGSPTGFTIDETCGGPPCKPVIWSQLQPFIGLSVGYDILQWLGVQISFGTGFVANAAPYNTSLETPRDYGMTFANLAVVGSFYVLDRLALMAKLFGGATFLSPEPLPGEPTIGGNGGLGIGVRYATLLPDVFVGVDGNFAVSYVPSSGGAGLIIPSISFAPVIKYVF